MNNIEQRTREQALYCANLVLNGCSKEQIAELTGLNPQSVVRMVNVVLPQVDKEMSEKVMNYIADSKPVCKVEVADAPVEPKKRGRKPVSDEKVLEVAERILNGETAIGIAKDMGVNPNTITNWMHKNLSKLDPEKYESVCERFKHNKAPNVYVRESDPDEVKEKAIKIADYIIENNSTVAEANRHYGVAPTNMHYVNFVLPTVDGKRYKQVRNIIDSRKKQTTPSNATQNGLGKVTYEFKKGNEPMYNSTAICKYVLDNKTNLRETAEHFGISSTMALTFIDYMERLDKSKYDKVIDIVLRGHYTGGEYIKAVGRTGASEEVKRQNSHNVCDYMIVNEASVSETSRFFGMDRNVINKAIDRMIEYDYDKYVAVKEAQKLHGNNIKIMPNPNAVVEEEVIEEPVKDIEEPVILIDEPVVEEVVETMKEYRVEPEKKMSFWQKVKYAFGFGG